MANLKNINFMSEARFNSWVEFSEDELIAEIESLKVERAEVVAKIKEENPYPEETFNS